MFPVFLPALGKDGSAEPVDGWPVYLVMLGLLFSCNFTYLPSISMFFH